MIYTYEFKKDDYLLKVLAEQGCTIEEYFQINDCSEDHLPCDLKEGDEIFLCDRNLGFDKDFPGVEEILKRHSISIDTFNELMSYGLDVSDVTDESPDNIQSLKELLVKAFETLGLKFLLDNARKNHLARLEKIASYGNLVAVRQAYSDMTKIRDNNPDMGNMLSDVLVRKIINMGMRTSVDLRIVIDLLTESEESHAEYLRFKAREEVWEAAWNKMMNEHH